MAVRFRLKENLKTSSGMEISGIENNPGKYDVLEKRKDEEEIRPTALTEEYFLSGFQISDASLDQ